VIRIDPEDGTVVDSSDVMVSDFYQPRMAVGRAGNVFVTNGGFSQGALYAFYAGNLGLNWSTAIPNVNVGGPALGSMSSLVVCGIGTDVRMYQTTDPLSVETGDGTVTETPFLAQNYPNPFNSISNFEFGTSDWGDVSLKVFDVLGREVTTIVSERLAPGTHTRRWDAAGLPSGTYFFRLSVAQANGETFTQTRRTLLIR